MLLSCPAGHFLVFRPVNFILATSILLLYLDPSMCKAKIRNEVPSIMMQLYRKNNVDDCDLGVPVVSIPANASIGSDSSAAEDTTSFAFSMIRDADVQQVRRTRLALDFPHACILRAAGRNPPAEPVALTATASGWTGSRQMVFRLQSSTYLAHIRASSALLQGHVFRVTLWTNETHGFPCPPSQASASLILNYPICRKKSARRLKRNHYYKTGPGSLRPDPMEWWRWRADDRSNNCRVVPLTVDFHRIGWDQWVLAPSTYMANQCAGQCTYTVIRRLNGTNHATVLSLLRDMPLQEVTEACCVPVRYAPQSMLYVDKHGNVVLKTFTDMRVAECQCR